MISRVPRGRALVGLALLALLPAVLDAIFDPLHAGEPGGFGIIAFELAGSVDNAEEILARWRAEDVIGMAKTIQLVDLVYPFVYAFALAGGCLAAGRAWERAGRPSPARLGIPLAAAALAAVAFDLVENLGIAVSLWGDPASPWPQLTLVAALVKFTLIAVTLLFALSGLMAHARSRTAAAPR